MNTLTIDIPEAVELQEVKLLIAAVLFQKGILSSGQAAEIAEISRKQFLEDVGQLGVSIFGETEEDIERLDMLEI
jgi:predicted HTH domain antitoxin